MIHALVLSMCLAAPAAAKPGDTPPPDAVGWYAADGDVAEAAAALETLATTSRKTDAGWYWLYAGEAWLVADRPEAARTAFEQALAEARTKGARDAAELGRLLAMAGDTPEGAARLRIERLDATEAPSGLRALQAMWRALGAADAARPNDAPAVALSWSQPYPPLHARIAARLETASAARAARLGDPVEVARETAARGEHLADDLELPDALRRAAAATQTPGRVGVLLPLSGRFATVGTQVQEAVTLGWHQAGREDAPYFVDAGETPASAVAAMERLIFEDGAIGVVGPITSAGAPPVATLANEAGVPLIAMNTAVDQTAQPWTHQAWVTLPQQVEVLADHATGELARSRFLVLTPDNAYGQAAGDLFAEAVAARGAEVVQRATYPTDTADFRELAAGLAPKADEDSPPEVAFDAVFVPDKARRVTLVAAGLAFAEIPLGSYQPHENQAGVVALGLSGWNSYNLASGGGPYLSRAVFTDVFVPPPSSEAWRWYPADGWSEAVDAFREATGRVPTSIEMLAVVAGRAAAACADAPHRAACRDALAAVTLQDTPTGATGFDAETRALDHRIRILSVRKDGFSPVEPSPEPPG